jgi:hypothetical protein
VALLFVTSTTAQAAFKVLQEMYNYKTEIGTGWDTESEDIITYSSHDCEPEQDMEFV